MRLVLLLTYLATLLTAPAADKIRVLVWDEQQKINKKVYDSFPGEHLAAELGRNPAFEVRSAKLDDPEQGLSSETLAATDVLLYWGHVRQRVISEEKGQEIADLVKAGKLAFVPLHSAHWSVPFMVCMQEKAAQDALVALAPEARATAKVVFEGKIQWKKAGEFSRNLFPPRYEIAPDGKVTVHVPRPNCVFPRCCGPGQPARVRILHKKHPICKGLPADFVLEETEMYDEPFGIPEPDTVLFTEHWAAGEFFRSGCLWNLGKGQVFYFRPGDQAYPLYKNKHLLKILENACLWLGSEE